LLSADGLAGFKAGLTNLRSSPRQKHKGFQQESQPGRHGPGRLGQYAQQQLQGQVRQAGTAAALGTSLPPPPPLCTPALLPRPAPCAATASAARPRLPPHMSRQQQRSRSRLESARPEAVRCCVPGAAIRHMRQPAKRGWCLTGCRPGGSRGGLIHMIKQVLGTRRCVLLAQFVLQGKKAAARPTAESCSAGQDCSGSYIRNWVVRRQPPNRQTAQQQSPMFAAHLWFNLLPRAPYKGTPGSALPTSCRRDDRLQQGKGRHPLQSIGTLNGQV
jgi:hypothetical protein